MTVRLGLKPVFADAGISADVVGIDARQVIRTDPRPNTSDFEPNCFPSIEFDRVDFPWLFTPAAANSQDRLRPRPGGAPGWCWTCRCSRPADPTSCRPST